ncbi:MAG: helix-turn-helix transcriptional regulator, partial [Solirubrobacteraceae bacterium]
MTAGQVAELLSVPKTRVWSMSHRGEIPTVRIGSREVRYRPEDIEAWIARRGRAARSPELRGFGERRGHGVDRPFQDGAVVIGDEQGNVLRSIR